MDLYELELSLFKGEYLKDYDYLCNIFHNDYMEYGKSGLVYRKDDTIKSLYDKDDRNIKVIDFNSNKIDDKTYINHYVSVHEDGTLVLRTSIWVDNGNMQLLFHQGTVANEEYYLINSNK